MTRVAVVVPVRDDPRLALCRQALAGQRLPPGVDVEVVVVDDGSRVPVAGALRQPPAGSYAARNRGVAASRGDVLAFTDADCLPAPDWLARGLGALATSGVVAGAVEVVTRARPGAVELYDALTAFPQEDFVRRWGFGVTADLLVRREVFELVGPFDARLRSGGDADWGERATALGHRAVYAPDVRVRHPARTRVAELAEKAVRTARGVEVLGVLRDEVTPLPEALRRHLSSPAGRLRAAAAAGTGRRDLLRLAPVAVLAAGLGAAEVLRGRAARGYLQRMSGFQVTQVQKALKGADYPMDGAQLSELAQKNGGDADLVEALKGLRQVDGPNTVMKELKGSLGGPTEG